MIYIFSLSSLAFFLVAKRKTLNVCLDQSGAHFHLAKSSAVDPLNERGKLSE